MKKSVKAVLAAVMLTLAVGAIGATFVYSAVSAHASQNDPNP